MPRSPFWPTAAIILRGSFFQSLSADGLLSYLAAQSEGWRGRQRCEALHRLRDDLAAEHILTRAVLVAKNLTAYAASALGTVFADADVLHPPDEAVGRISPHLGRVSPQLGRISPQLDRISPQLGRISPQLRASPDEATRPDVPASSARPMGAGAMGAGAMGRGEGPIAPLHSHPRAD